MCQVGHLAYALKAMYVSAENVLTKYTQLLDLEKLNTKENPTGVFSWCREDLLCGGRMVVSDEMHQQHIDG